MQIEELIETLNRAKEAQDILNRVLSYYNIYSGQFDKIPDYDAEHIFRCSDDALIRNTLNARIRAYKDFDDSE